MQRLDIEKRVRDVRQILSNPRVQSKIEAAQQRWEDKYRPLTDPIQCSARLATEDYEVTITSPPVRYRH
ncbi:hypothetical protein J4422_02205 [Candidatus Pacearchaeota archaeon]|nr:hypothetical protein [Candidatus Pacearchaeota archaeon]